MIKKLFLVCGVSNALDGSQNHIIRCSKELPTLSVAYSSNTETSDKDPFESSDPEGGQNKQVALMKKPRQMKKLRQVLPMKKLR